MLVSLGSVDFDFSVGKVDIEASIDGDAVSVRVEYVADDLSVRKWMVADEFLHSSRYLVR